MKKVGNYTLDLEKPLGKGAFGTVYCGVQDSNNATVAAKIISISFLNQGADSAKMKELLNREIKILREIHNPNIVKMKDAFITPNNVYLIFEYCGDGDLECYRNKNGVKSRLTESETLKFMSHICNGFKTLCNLKIIHRDIKPSNILLHGGNAKIADFGFARFIDHESNNITMTVGIGTPLYMAPEIYRGTVYTSKCDVWSFGVMIFELLYGMTPWIGKSAHHLFESVIPGGFSFPSKPKCSKEIKDLIKRMLTIDENERISWEEIFDHPLIKTNFLFDNKNLDITPNNGLRQSMIMNGKQVNHNPVKGHLNTVEDENEEKSESEQKEKKVPSKKINEIQSTKQQSDSLLRGASYIYYERNIAYFLKAGCQSVFCLQTNIDENVLYMTVFLMIKQNLMVMKKLNDIVNEEIYHEFVKPTAILPKVKKNINQDYDECYNVFKEVLNFMSDLFKKWKNNANILLFERICNEDFEFTEEFCLIYEKVMNKFYDALLKTFKNDPSKNNRDFLKALRFCQIAQTINGPYNYFKNGENSKNDFYQFYDEIKNLEENELAEKILEYKNK